MKGRDIYLDFRLESILKKVGIEERVNLKLEQRAVKAKKLFFLALRDSNRELIPGE